MSEIRDRLEREKEKLETLRDELRVQLDLGKKEVEDAWEEAEHRWNKLEAQIDRFKREGSETLEDIGEAAELLVGEIRAGFNDLKKLL